MLARIDLGDVGTTSRPHEVERGWCDYPYRILKRRGDMEVEAERIRRRPAAVSDAHRGDETRAFAVGDLILVALDHRWRVRRLADRGCCSSQGETTGQRGAAFQEVPSRRSFRVHLASPSQLKPGS